jgi:hypothetical protein
MAGSFNHLAGDEGGWSFIENMGDAHEAVHELLWLVFFFAVNAGSTSNLDDAKRTIVRALDQIYYPQMRREDDKDAAFIEVDRIMSDQRR